MYLHLERPLVVLDTETTGVDRDKDHIISICLHKYTEFPGTPERFNWLVNPLMAIPPESIAIHGITDAMVATAKPFYAMAKELLAVLEGCDLAGYGAIHFDVPLLHNEFERAGIAWQPGHVIDAGNLFKIKETRTLTAAVKFYCGRTMERAHDAEVDVVETANVLLAQLAHYGNLPTNVPELARLTNYGNKRADVHNKFYFDTMGICRFGFGKYKDHPVMEHLDFLDWMYYRADFQADTRRMIEVLWQMAADANAVTGEDLFSDLVY